MLTELEEPRVLRDPIHGYIHIRSPLIWQLLDTPEFQRLRRIRQLGGVFQVYHTAEHSRFSHSLGVYEIVRRMTEEVPDIARELNQRKSCRSCARPCFMISGMVLSLIPSSGFLPVHMTDDHQSDFAGYRNPSDSGSCRFPAAGRNGSDYSGDASENASVRYDFRTAGCRPDGLSAAGCL